VVAWSVGVVGHVAGVWCWVDRCCCVSSLTRGVVVVLRAVVVAGKRRWWGTGIERPYGVGVGL
jgi:hypothetical protein